MTGTYTGILFTPRARPLTGVAHNGAWQFNAALIERLGPHHITLWRVFWAGAPAQAWWAQHAHLWLPGQPWAVQLQHLRTHGLRGLAAEIHADVIQLDPAPLSHPRCAAQHRPACTC